MAFNRFIITGSMTHCWGGIETRPAEEAVDEFASCCGKEADDDDEDVARGMANVVFDFRFALQNDLCELQLAFWHSEPQ